MVEFMSFIIGKGDSMPKPRSKTGKKNVTGLQIIALRKRDGLSQRELAHRLQLMGFDMDKNVITRIETGKRYVADFEISAFSKIFNVSYEYLIDGIPDKD